MVSELSSTIKNAGFETCQLAITKAVQNISTFSEIDDRLLEEIGKTFDENEIDIAVLGCYIEPSISDKTERMEQIRNFKLGLAHAHKLKINIVGTETTNFDISRSHSDRMKAYENLKDSAQRMSEEAHKLGVYIGIEPVAEHVLNTPELTAQLFDEIDSSMLRIIFDPVNLVLNDTISKQTEIFDYLFKYLGHKIVALHMKDTTFNNNSKVWENIGHGLIDYEHIFKWLHLHKPLVPLIREGIQLDSYERDIVMMNEYKFQI
jgi:sugar phosphate isomerase/epimerase